MNARLNRWRWLVVAIGLVLVASRAAADPPPSRLLCEFFKERNALQRPEQALVQKLAEARVETGGHATGEAADSPADETATIELTRERLAARMLDTEADLLDLVCDRAQPVEDPVAYRHRIEALQRSWLQLDCHRAGKELAIAELQRERSSDFLDYFKARVERCIDSGQAAGEVRFPTEDGGTVHARLYGVGRTGVVLAHGGRYNKESWAEQATALAEAEFRVLAIDFRGRGGSRGPDGARGNAYHDVLAAARYLRDTGSESVSVVGASFGGGAAARASTEAGPGEIDALVLLAHASIDQPEKMQGRKLCILARDGVRAGGVGRLDEIRRQYEATSEPNRLVLLDGTAHDQQLFQTDPAERLMSEILSFLQPR